MSWFYNWFKGLKKTEVRPWGEYQVLFENKNIKVKKITVNPKSKLSYQSHNHRKEDWYVYKGIMTVVLDGNNFKLKKDDKIHIPLGSKHRAWNESKNETSFIEIQRGDYFGEDDIIRYSDEYNRI